MKKLVFLCFIVFVSVAEGQVADDGFCSQIDEIENLNTHEVNQLQSEVEQLYKDMFEQASEISNGMSALSDSWLKESFILQISDCYYQGNQAPKDLIKAKNYLKVAIELGNKSATHRLASIELFKSTDFQEQTKGFKTIEAEYKAGSAFAAGKLGWAYQKGLGVKPNLEKALELYHYAANAGMTYWQFLLAHAYEQGYLNLKKDLTKSQHWLNFKPKVHFARYECWVATFYEDGTFPANDKVYKKFSEQCKQ